MIEYSDPDARRLYKSKVALSLTPPSLLISPLSFLLSLVSRIIFLDLRIRFDAFASDVQLYKALNQKKKNYIKLVCGVFLVLRLLHNRS